MSPLLLIFNEVERTNRGGLGWIRDIHDGTGCPVLRCGRPKLYSRLGLRELGDFSEVNDRLASRIVVRRDLTGRARGDDPEPLFSRDDIRALIRQWGLKLRIEPDGEKWLQSRASTIGLGGLRGRVDQCSPGRSRGLCSGRKRYHPSPPRSGGRCAGGW